MIHPKHSLDSNNEGIRCLLVALLLPGPSFHVQRDRTQLPKGALWEDLVEVLKGTQKRVSQSSVEKDSNHLDYYQERESEKKRVKCLVTVPSDSSNSRKVSSHHVQHLAEQTQKIFSPDCITHIATSYPCSVFCRRCCDPQ